jgi:hypothetical protein
MSNPIGDPGHGHSPAAWTAVIIMLARSRSARCFWSRPAVAGVDSRGLLVGALVGWGMAKAGYGVERLEVHAERALNMLADLTAGAVQDAEARASERPLAVVEAAALRSAALDALAALAPPTGVKIIAEVKRASPSRGELAEIPIRRCRPRLLRAGRRVHHLGAHRGRASREPGRPQRPCAPR